MKKLLTILSLAACVSAHALDTPIFNLLLQGKANGGGVRMTNLSELVVSNIYVQSFDGPGTNRFGGAGSTNGQTPWVQDIDGNRFSLTNAQTIRVQKGGTFSTNTAGVSDGGVFFANPGGSDNGFVAGDNALKLSTADDYSAIVGGDSHFIGINSDNCGIFGGRANSIGSQDNYSVIVGGFRNTNENNSFVPVSSKANGIFSGGNNVVLTNSYRSVVVGGSSNRVGDSHSIAMGFRATSTNRSTFVWSDDQGSEMATTGTNQVLFRALNGFAINTNNPGGYTLKVNGSSDVTSASFVAGKKVVAPTNSPTDGYVVTAIGSNAVWSVGSSGGGGSNQVVQSFYRYPPFATEFAVVPLGGLLQTIFWQLGDAQFFRVGGGGGILSFDATGWRGTTAAQYETHDYYVACVYSNISINYPVNWIFLTATNPVIYSNQIVQLQFAKIGNNTNVFVKQFTATNSLVPSL